MYHKISEKKLFTILSIDLFSMTGLIFPAVIVRAGGKQGLPAFFIASGLATLLACYFLWIGGEENISYGEMVSQMPCWERRLIKFIYVGRYFLHGLFLMVVFCNLMKKMLLPAQNRALLLFPFFLLTYLSVKKDLSMRGTMLEVLFPFIFGPLLLVLFLGLFQIDYGSLPEQLWAGGIWEGNGQAVYQIFLFYQPMEFLLFLLPYRERKGSEGKGEKAVFLAVFFAILVNLFFYIVAVGMFGTQQTEKNLWSALSIMQSVKFPGYFVQRLDILLLVFYIFSTFSLFSGFLFYSQMLVLEKKPFFYKKMKKQEKSQKNKYQIGYLLLLFLASIVVTDIEGFYDFFGSYKRWMDVPFALVVPLLVRWQWKRGNEGSK